MGFHTQTGSTTHGYNEYLLPSCKTSGKVYLITLTTFINGLSFRRRAAANWVEKLNGWQDSNRQTSLPKCANLKGHRSFGEKRLFLVTMFSIIYVDPLYLFCDTCLAVFVLPHPRSHNLFRVTLFETSRFCHASNNRVTSLLWFCTFVYCCIRDTPAPRRKISFSHPIFDLCLLSPADRGGSVNCDK